MRRGKERKGLGAERSRNRANQSSISKVPLGDNLYRDMTEVSAPLYVANFRLLRKEPQKSKHEGERRIQENKTTPPYPQRQFRPNPLS